MKKTDPTNDNITSRIIHGLKSEYRIVSLPFWAWFWLDDFMLQNRISYQGILTTFRNGSDVNDTLRGIAELHQDHCMRDIYKLSNDNDFLERNNKPTCLNIKREPKKKNRSMPKIYKLFGFMPCTTTLDSIWTRKNYDENNKIN